MESLHVWQKADPVRFQRIGYRIHKRGTREASRVNKFFSYEGPDDATLQLLSAHEPLWMAQPLSFWTRPEPNRAISRLASSTTRLVGLYINAKRDDA